MDRINTATKALDLFGPGKHGFKDGNLALAIQSTDLDAEFFNGLQEETIGVIEAAGLAPNAADRTQLRQAIDVMISRATGNDYKASVRVATTANIASLDGGAPNELDGVALAANDRVLVKDQATPAQNGIFYVVTPGTGSDGAWARVLDADSAGELTSGAVVAVEEGAFYADSLWMLTTDGPITIGTTPLTFTRKDAATAVTGFRNKIINGGMSIDQRNTGAAQTFTAGAALAYCVDRWYGYCTGANVNGQRVAGSGVAQHRYQFAGAASVTGIGFGQRIEKANSIDLAGSTATLSVDLANSLLATVNWTAYYANSDDTFGTLASPTRTQIATGSFNVTGALARYSAQINIPSGATTGIEVVFSVGAQVGGTWTIGDVQLEAGATASAFERRPIATELSACQRYFEKFGGFVGDLYAGGYVSSGQGAANFYQFKTQKRATPTMAQAGTFGVSAVSSPTLVGVATSINGFGLSGLASATGTYSWYTNGAGNYVTATAEL